jgi:meiotically up-regulated gene 157 (Mug157) protein
MDRLQFTIGTLVDSAGGIREAKSSAGAFAEPSSALPIADEMKVPDVAFPTSCPPENQRAFVSDAVEDVIVDVTRRIRNPRLGTLFENCYPNTLDTTVQLSVQNGKPDTFIVTGDIAAMWLRNSTAQVLPYLRLAPKDKRLQLLFRGLIHRQADCVLLDSYANAFYATRKMGVWATDVTDMHTGVHERKWEVDSLCYPIRLAYNYLSVTGDSEPLDENLHKAARRIVDTFREQQRLKNDGPYHFQRLTRMFYDNLLNHGLGNPTRKIGLLHSAFRPSDDACLFPFLIPSNLFAAVSLRQLQHLSIGVFRDKDLAGDAARLADQLDATIASYAIVNHPVHGKIYAFEIDGFGNSLIMDDANAPSLLSLPYFGCCELEDATYQRTRAFALSDDNPYFIRGVAEGIGGPHVGPCDMAALDHHACADKPRFKRDFALSANAAGDERWNGLHARVLRCQRPEKIHAPVVCMVQFSFRRTCGSSRQFSSRYLREGLTEQIGAEPVASQFNIVFADFENNETVVSRRRK